MQRKIRSAGFIICIFVRGPEEQSSGIFRRFLRLDSKKDLTLDTLFHTIQIQEAFQIHQKNQTCSVPPSSKPLALCLWLGEFILRVSRTQPRMNGGRAHKHTPNLMYKYSNHARHIVHRHASTGRSAWLRDPAVREHLVLSFGSNLRRVTDRQYLRFAWFFNSNHLSRDHFL